MYRILIVDDHALIRIGLKQLLTGSFSQCVLGEARDGRETVQQVSSRNWDIVLLDITMPGRSGVEVLRDIKAVQPKLPVLILSACSEEQFALRVMQAGAAGFLRKESAPEELVKAIKHILAGHKYISTTLADKLAASVHDGADKPLHERLSDREYEVMCLIAKGRTPTQIAASLSLSVKTISTYRTRVLEKIHLSTNAELTYYAIKNGLVE